nr:MAG TPA: hypothetical protein [Caudoviricetes sp.]
MFHPMFHLQCSVVPAMFQSMFHPIWFINTTPGCSKQLFSSLYLLYVVSGTLEHSLLNRPVNREIRGSRENTHSLIRLIRANYTRACARGGTDERKSN